MPDDPIRLTLPPDAELVSVASIAVRAVARQVALSEVDIDRLRAAVAEAFTAQAATTDDPIELVFRPDVGHMTIEVGPTVIE